MMTVGDREFLLADVIKSTRNIGLCNITGRLTGIGDRQPVTELLYAGEEPLISMVRPSINDRTSNRLISQIGIITDDNIKTRLSAAGDNYFTYSQSLGKSLQPVLEILDTGLYVCHVSKMIPSDGAGNFFWNAYTVRHEVAGTAEYSSVIGRENNFIPCFLVPTTNISDYSEQRTRSQLEKLKSGKKIGGVAFHLSGLFSALLDGHHSSVACLLNDSDFNCIVIEPVRQVLYESQETAADYGREPKIIALSSPYAKIPLSGVPEGMLENFLLKRYYEKPVIYDTMKSKATRTLRVVSKRLLSSQVYLKADLLPDCAMIESAHAVTSLSDAQIDALLSGETKYNDEIIISGNYYNSVVTACNYLQYMDFDRFLYFAISIMKNPDLSATHKYIAERLSNIINEQIYNYFCEVAAEEDNTHIEIRGIAESYISRYDNLSAEQERELKKNSKIKFALSQLDGDMDELGIAKMEAFIKKTRGSSRT